MKKLQILFSLSAMILLIACSGEPDTKSTDTAEDNVQENPPQNTITNSTTIDAGDTETVDGSAMASYHYICPNKCEGGGAAAPGNCPVCGTALTHNSAFHSQNNANAASNQATPPQFQQQPQSNEQPQLNLTPPPAQNEAGVYHYTCPSGCEGGAAKAGPCSKCGAELTHNKAYHQN